jgi:hypothetical protein
VPGVDHTTHARDRARHRGDDRRRACRYPASYREGLERGPVPARSNLARPLESEQPRAAGSPDGSFLQPDDGRPLEWNRRYGPASESASIIFGTTGAARATTIITG